MNKRQKVMQALSLAANPANLPDFLPEQIAVLNKYRLQNPTIGAKEPLTPENIFKKYHGFLTLSFETEQQYFNYKDELGALPELPNKLKILSLVP